MSHVSSRYGGNTSCMTVSSKGSQIIIDAGSGLNMLEREHQHDNNHNILISHLHMDHIIGLGTFAPVWKPDSETRIYTCSRDSRPLNEQVFGMFKPPYWPSCLATISGAECIPIASRSSFTIGCFTVTPFTASHPDKTLSFHITDGKKNFVHLLDSEVYDMSQVLYEEMFSFCQNADMVVFDAAYSSDDYPRFFKGWGHSTVEQGVKFAKACKPKRMLFAHFGQQYTDYQLDSWSQHFEGDTEFILARDGIEIQI